MVVGEMILGGKGKVRGFKAVGRVGTRIRVPNPSCEKGSGGRGEGEGWFEVDGESMRSRGGVNTSFN